MVIFTSNFNAIIKLHNYETDATPLDGVNLENLLLEVDNCCEQDEDYCTQSAVHYRDLCSCVESHAECHSDIDGYPKTPIQKFLKKNKDTNSKVSEKNIQDI